MPHHVLMGLVGVEGAQVGGHVGGLQLAIVLGQGDHLVARRLDGARLVHRDVPGVGCDHAFVAGEQRRDDHGVGLRAAHEEEHVGGVVGAGGADALCSARAEPVGTVARSRLQVGGGQGFKDTRMRAGGIVVLEGNHGAPRDGGKGTGARYVLQPMIAFIEAVGFPA